MTTQEEFRLLQQLFATEDGWRQIEKEWHAATNTEKDPSGYGILVKKVSSGDTVSGFAIDSDTLQHVMGVPGWDHGGPKLELISELLRSDVDCDEAEYRVIDGRAIPVPSLINPLIFLSGRRLLEEDGLLQKLEDHILEQGIGLPLHGLFNKAMDAGWVK